MMDYFRLRYQEKHGDKPTNFSELQKQVFNGIMLGDAHISRSGVLSYKQKESKQEHVVYIHDIFIPFSNDVRHVYSKCDGKHYKQFVFTTPKLDIFSSMREKWYPNGIKSLPSDLKLTPMTVAMWHCDDGCNYQPKKEIRLSTESFSNEEVSRLIRMFEEFNIIGMIKPTKSGPVLKISKKCYYDFINLIKSNITCECDQYKIDTSKVYIPSYKIYESTAENICKMYATGMYSQRELAKIFNVNCSTICRVTLRKYSRKGLF